MGYSCDFCVRLAVGRLQRPWYDFHLLGGSRNFVVVAALGALAPGHIMIVSRVHIERMADLEACALAELEKLASDWLDRLSRHWSDPVFMFEHGGRSSTSSGSCIAHAHMQLVPLSSPPQLSWPNSVFVQSIRDLGVFNSQDYLLVVTNDSVEVRSGFTERGQYMRRVIAASRKEAYRWDYLMYPNLDRVRETICRLKECRDPSRTWTGTDITRNFVL